MAGSSSSSGKGVGRGIRKGAAIVWEGSLGPDSFDEPLYEFPIERKRDFTRERPLRSYDNQNEDWPKCRHGEDCVVQVYNDDDGGGRRFFRCPRGWVFVFSFMFPKKNLLSVCTRLLFKIVLIFLVICFLFRIQVTQRTVASPDGSIPLLFFPIDNISCTCKVVSST